MLAGSGTMVGLNISLLFIEIFSSANDAADEGVLVHARDNSDLTWINHFVCSTTNNYVYYAGRDYYTLGLYGETSKDTGVWCGADARDNFYFICEGFI